MFIARRPLLRPKAVNLAAAGAWAESTAAAVFDFDFGSPFSAAVWINAQFGAWGSGGRILAGKIKVEHTAGSDRGWYLELSGFAGQPGLFLSHSYTGSNNDWLYVIGNSGGTIMDTGWRHVVATYGGGTTHASMKLYVDGSARTVTNFGGPLPGSPTMLNAQKVSWGGRRDAAGVLETGNRCTGKMHDLALWNVELTPTQILDVYGAGRPNGKVPRLESAAAWPAPVAYWPARSGDTFPIPDKMGTGQAMAAQGSPTLETR